MEDVVAGTEFKYSTQEVPRIIKVVGVGGGGGNAVTHMYTSGQVPGVSFLLLNTDEQALRESAVEHKVVLGQGLGAGNRPEVARDAALDSADDIRSALCDGDTKMVFITAGMGGGTGTGASSVVGRIAMDAGLLVVGIVTVPFAFEGRKKILKALQGVRELAKNVDALLVVNNEKLIELEPKFDLARAFKYADETLATASKGISDMINTPAQVNLDFADVRTTLKDGGVAVINTGYGAGDRRVTKAIDDAMHSPLFNNNNVRNAGRLLFFVYSPKDEPVTMEEMAELSDFMDSLRDDIDVIWGASLEADVDKLAITVLASGFDFSETDRFFRTTMAGEGQAKPTNGEASSAATPEEEAFIQTIYGKGVVGASRTRKAEPLILTLDELDCEELLEELERTPAFKRSAKVAEEIRVRYRHMPPSSASSQTSSHIHSVAGGSGSLAQTSRPEPLRNEGGGTRQGEDVTPRSNSPQAMEEETTVADEQGDVIFF